MKKLLLILLCVPLIGVGQTAEEYFDKAYDYEKNGEYQLAIDNYTKCLRVDPDYADAYYNRGLAYGKGLYNLEDAISDFTRAIRIDPDYTNAYYNRGFAYDELGNYEDAIADYTRAIRIDPDYADAYYNRGTVYGRYLGNYEDAIADFTRAIRIDPDYANAYANRGTAKWYLKLDYCGDFKIACDLGRCNNYNNFCK